MSGDQVQGGERRLVNGNGTLQATDSTVRHAHPRRGDNASSRPSRLTNGNVTGESHPNRHLPNGTIAAERRSVEEDQSTGRNDDRRPAVRIQTRITTDDERPLTNGFAYGDGRPVSRLTNGVITGTDHQMEDNSDDDDGYSPTPPPTNTPRRSSIREVSEERLPNGVNGTNSR